MLENISTEGLERMNKDLVVMIDKEEFQSLPTDKFQKRLGMNAEEMAQAARSARSGPVKAGSLTMC